MIIQPFKYLFYLLIAILPVFLTARSQSISPGDYKLFLIGDAGSASKDDQVMTLLKSKLHEAGAQGCVVFLGDNIYPAGLPPVGERGRSEAEERLRNQLNILKDFKGQGFVIPGNHDWKEGSKDGRAYLMEEQKYIGEYLNDSVFYPKGGCPGPVEISLADDIVLIILDTQWFLQKKNKTQPDCKDINLIHYSTSIENMIKKNKDKRIVIAGHHPMYSLGPHGGYFPLKAHFFPLTEFSRLLYIPLPVFGTLYVVIRKYFGPRQDLSNPKYKLLKKELTKVFKKYPGIIYVSGHDHSLQFYVRDSTNYIVSGSGSKLSYVKKAKGQDYSALHKGFAEIYFHASNADSVKYFLAEPQMQSGKPAFAVPLK